jgi:hypothetical protein
MSGPLIAPNAYGLLNEPAATPGETFCDMLTCKRHEGETSYR